MENTNTLRLYAATPVKGWAPVLVAVDENNCIQWIQLGPGTEFHRFYVADEKLIFDATVYEHVVRVA